jgi:hypothetical protein
MRKIPEKESEELIAFIRKAFSSVPAPAEWKQFSSVEDFQQAYGDDFFPASWETIYNWETDEIRYFTPFMMEFHILQYNERLEDHRLDLLVLFLQNPREEFEPIRARCLEIYDAFNQIESEAICRFLEFINKYDLGYFRGITEIAIEYWAERANR